ncbi:hypothetical protein GCM10028784_25370 [Myceligenerans cantabricum]
MTHRTDPDLAAERDQPAPAPGGRGLAAVTGDQFSPLAAVGGVRGMAESVAPGVVFVVLFVILQDLLVPLVASLAVAVAATVVRLVQRTPLTTALGGLVGVVIGAVWAWRTGDAENVFVWALWTNAAYLVAMLVSILVRWPAIGLFVEALASGLTPDQVRKNAEADQAPSSDAAPGEPSGRDRADDEPSPFAALTVWRQDPAKVRAYTIATWLWVAMFALRLAVKTPLYLAGTVGWLGTFHLVLGVPLFALVLFGCWIVIRPVLSGGAAAEPGRRRHP